MTRLPVLTYHSLDEHGSAISVRPAVFRAHMLALRAAGWRTLTLDALLDGHGRGGWADRSLLITFDDGLASFETVAMPGLVECGFSALLFVVAGFVGRDNQWPNQPTSVPRQRLLDWPALRDLPAGTVEVGAHSVTHPDLTRISPEDAQEEIVASKCLVEDRLGRSVRAFAYPYGARTDALGAEVRRRFAAAFTTELRYVTGGSPLEALERIDAVYLPLARMTRDLERPWMARYLEVRRFLRRARYGW